MQNSRTSRFTEEQVAAARRYAIAAQPPELDARVEALVRELINRVADKWTMHVLDALADHGELRFSELNRQLGDVSQKVLTQTLRRMERDGLVIRTVHPEVPPRVEYRLTTLGTGLSSAFCGVWVWAAENLDDVEHARSAFDGNSKGPHSAS